MWKKVLLSIGVLIVVVLGGAYVFLNQPDIPRAALEAKYTAAPSQFVTLSDGARVHYRDRGPRDAPVLLLLHGSNSSLFDWEPWSKILSNLPLNADKDVAYAAEIGMGIKATHLSEWEKALLIEQMRSKMHWDRWRIISVDLPVTV